MTRFQTWLDMYRLRLKRRRLLFRALWARRQLRAVLDRTNAIRGGDILLFATVRNEAARLPYFLSHYRRMGVTHFLFIVNDSSDGTLDLLDAPDISVWQTDHSYRASRFGMDWMNWLLMRYGHGHWCLSVDADELLILPSDRAGLPELTRWLDAQGAEAFAALMLDLYPRGPLSSAICAPGKDPASVLGWYDAQGYTWERQPRFANISIRGGARKRMFFCGTPDNAPHLHKTPLIRWNRRFAYLSSTHVALPRRLNTGFDARRALPTGVLLHTKFLDQIIPKSGDEKLRREHFTHFRDYDSYYDKIVSDPVLWRPDSAPLSGWRGLVDQGLMSRGGYTDE